METQEHLFFQCNFAKQVWDLIPWSPSITYSSDATFAEALQVSQTLKNIPPLGVVGNIFPWVCWYLWITRNKLIFESKASSPQEFIARAICSMKEWESAQQTCASAALEKNASAPPLTLPTDTIFCNTDAAWKSESKSAGLAWIFSDQSNREISRSATTQDFVNSPCMAEGLAIRESLLEAASLNFSHICLRTDSQVLAKAFNRKTSTIELYGLLSDIDSLISSSSSPFVFSSVVNIPRTANGPADQLAKAHLSAHLSL